ncbi:MAG: phosphotransferase [Prevotella sp.]|nr:phosphotransferase [Prevotella sp.]
MDGLKTLYRTWCGEEPNHVERLAGAGSNREYYRLSAPVGSTMPATVIGCVGTSCEENHAFITLARHFAEKSLPVPEILAVSDDELRYLQTDLGSVSLFDALQKGRAEGYSDDDVHLLEETIRLLPRLQIVGAEGLDWSVCYPQPSFDEQNVMFDLNYFKYCFLKPSGLDFHELKLEADFRRMAADLTASEATGFMYRDFQARNVMLYPPPNAKESPSLHLHSSLTSLSTPYFIDFQGGRCGPLEYDLASFLWQASAHYPDTLRQHLIDVYFDELQKYAKTPVREEFDHRLRLFVLFRTLQVLGAYGYRGYFERKKHFIDSIPPAIDNLRCHLSTDYPYLHDVLQQLVALPKFQKPVTDDSNDGKLVVRVFSFSYKKGIPEDESGNGGGYVFDCRSTHNPGRYEPYKKLTGLDEPVIRFLEDDGEITTFLDSVYKLADAHVERYLERGFTSLMFSFGCTGGQHRSVYSAQHLAEHLHQKYGIEVRLCHREQGISTTYK